MQCFNMQSVVAERFIRTLKNKIYKHMAAVSKNVYVDVLDDIVNKYNNTFHRTIKIKPIDVKSNIYAEYNVDSNKQSSKFNAGEHVIVSKYKKFFAKEYTSNWSEEVFVIRKIKNTVPWTYVVKDLNGKKTVGTFYEKERQKPNQKEFRIEKVIKKKGNKLFLKWKGYENSFNSWIDESDLK